MTPKILSPERRMPLACLGLLIAAEAGALAMCGPALQSMIAAIARDGDVLSPLVVLAGVGGAGCVLAWHRAVLAEDVSMSYANDIRGLLMDHAVSGPGSQRRLGLLAVRMTGDVTPMREWVATGLADLGGALAAFAAAIFVLWLAAGALGVAGGCALGSCVIFALLAARPALGVRIRALRAERGRVSALAGDIVLSAATIGRLNAERRERRRFDERARGLRVAAVRRRRLAALLETPGGLVLPVVALLGFGLHGVAGRLDWALLMFAASLLALSFRSAGRAMDLYVAYAEAQARMAALASQLAVASAPRHGVDVTPPLAFFSATSSGGVIALEKGKVGLVRAASLTTAIDMVAGMADRRGTTWIEGLLIGSVGRRELNRRLVLVSPTLPLVRGSVRRNLSLGRRDVPDADMSAALQVVGLDPEEWPLDRRIDPSIDNPDLYAQALLRLARALSHGAEAIVVAEPLLYHAPEGPAIFEAVARAGGASVVAASAAPTREDQHLFDAGALTDVPSPTP